MNINTQFLQDHQAKLTVELEAEPFEAAKHRAARQIAKRTRIPGFRPGKAPYNVVLRTVGENHVVQEAMDLLLEEVYPKIIEQAEIKTYGPGQLSNIVSLDPPTLEFTVPLAPVVNLPEYDSIRFPYELSAVTDDDVDQVLQDLRDRYATFETVDRPAQDGDQVNLKLTAERKNPAEGQDPFLYNDRSTVLTVNPTDSEAKTEWPYSGFSRNLVGLSAGDEKTFDYIYPEDAQIENLRSVEMNYRIKIETVKVRNLPELNDEFAKTLGEYENLEALRKEIHTGLGEQRKSDYDKTYQNQIVDHILSGADIHYPPQMLERETDAFLSQLENRLAQQNLDMSTYLKARQLDEEGLRKEMQPSAEERLKRSLILMEIAKIEKIEVEEQLVQNETINTINQLHQYYKPEEARRIITQDFIQNVVGNITGEILLDKTLQHLTSIAKGEASKDQTSETPQASTEPQPEKKPAKKRKPRKETE